MEDNSFEQIVPRAGQAPLNSEKRAPEKLEAEAVGVQVLTGGANLSAFLSFQLSINAPPGNARVNFSARSAPGFAARRFFAPG